MTAPEPPLAHAAIAAAGIYDIPHKAYLADPVATPSLNNSVAKLFAFYSPAHARAAHPRFNAEPAAAPEPPAEASEEQDVGTIAHSMFLQGESNVVLVDVKDWRTKDARARRDDIKAEGKIALKKDRFDAVHRVVAALERFRAETGAFTAGQAERTLVWRDGPSWCRCKPDWLPDEPSAPIWDLKTVTGHATLRDWTRGAFQLGTDMQAAFYPRGAECVRGEPPAGMNFCVVETQPPFGLAVFRFSPTAMEVAEAKVRYALEQWAACLAADSWPGYDLSPQWVDPPVYILREWEHLTATGRSREQAPRLREAAVVGRMVESGNLAG